MNHSFIKKNRQTSRTRKKQHRLPPEVRTTEETNNTEITVEKKKAD